MTPTHVTEAWGGIYFQIIVTLLVFALGIPSLVVQIMMPTDVQRVLTSKRLRSSRWLLILTILYCGIAACFVWLYHPWQTGAGALDDWSGGSVITGVLILTLLFWVHQFQHGSREMVVRRMRSIILKEIQKNGFVEEDLVESLAFLGERGHSGHEKEICLSALADAGHKLQGLCSYCGESIEPLAMAIEATVSAETARARDVENGVRVLSSFVVRLEALSLVESPDAAMVFRTITRVSTRAVEYLPEALGLWLIETIGSFADVSDHLKAKGIFELGREAARSRKHLLALASLSKLESFVRHNSRDMDFDALHPYFLGLLAVYGSEGITIRESLIRRLKASVMELELPADAIFERASQFFQNRSDFATADSIVTLQASLYSTDTLLFKGSTN